jgi:hypothetical protein
MPNLFVTPVATINPALVACISPCRVIGWHYGVGDCPVKHVDFQDPPLQGETSPYRIFHYFIARLHLEGSLLNPSRIPPLSNLAFRIVITPSANLKNHVVEIFSMALQHLRRYSSLATLYSVGFISRNFLSPNTRSEDPCSSNFRVGNDKVFQKGIECMPLSAPSICASFLLNEKKSCNKSQNCMVECFRVDPGSNQG